VRRKVVKHVFALKPDAVDSPQIEHPLIGQVLKVGGSSGDGRAVIQPNSYPDTEQIFKAMGLSGPEGSPI
jgi:hypothetical protein